MPQEPEKTRSCAQLVHFRHSQAVRAVTVCRRFAAEAPRGRRGHVHLEGQRSAARRWRRRCSAAMATAALVGTASETASATAVTMAAASGKGGGGCKGGGCKGDGGDGGDGDDGGGDEGGGGAGSGGEGGGAGGGADGGGGERCRGGGHERFDPKAAFAGRP